MTAPKMTQERTLREVLLLPAVERTRAPRQSSAFLSRRRLLLIVALAFITLVVLPLTFRLTQVVKIPNVVGQTSALAEENLKKKGLTARVIERRFSVEKKDIVLDQSPEPSERYRTTRVVSLTVSAGTEQTTLPDFVGDNEVYATQALLQKGLVPVVIAETSVMLPGTILATSPAAGSQVTTGDSVTLRVSAAQDAVPLVKYSLNRKTLVIVPEFVDMDGQDVTYDVALRLSSLLKASGADVTISRNSGEQTQSTLSAAQGYVYLSVRKSGSSGIEVGNGITTFQPLQEPSADNLASLVFERLTSIQQNSRLISADQITLKPSLPKGTQKKSAVSVSLGALDSSIDRALITDPQFKDSVARGLYRAVGEYLVALPR